MRIGIDVGGTNTDAVLMDGDQVIAAVKRGTTPDVTGGIVAALEGLRDQLLQRRPATGSAAASGADGEGPTLGDVNAVMIGTTHFINALVEADRLAPRRPYGWACPRPRPCRRSSTGRTRWSRPSPAARYLCHGGHEFDGAAHLRLDPDELRRTADDIRAAGIRSVAISSVFSPVNIEFEERAAEILAAELPGVPISLSHEIGRIGLLERENATIVNAALRELATGIVDGLGRGDGGTRHHRAPLPQPERRHADGSGVRPTLPGRHLRLGADELHARRRGRCPASATCAVVDIGGTTSDIGILSGGFPREATTEVTVARRPHQLPHARRAVDRHRRRQPGPPGPRRVGPDSVGYRLPEQALVFGGSTLTATDIAVAAGRAEIGDPSLVAHLDRSMVQAVLERIADEVAEAVERMRTSPEPLPVVAVGGGSILLPDELPGCGALHRPGNYAVANAIGAAIAQIGGEVDRIYTVSRRPS